MSKSIQSLFLILLAGANIYAFFLPITDSLIIIAITAVFLLATELISPVSTSFLLIVLLYLHSPAPDEHIAFFGFQSPVIYFLIAVTGVGIALAQSTIGQWLMNQFQMMMLKFSLPLPVLLTFSFIPLSLLLPSSITRNAMLYPLMKDFLQQNHIENESKRVFLTLGTLNALASSAMITGGLSAIITANILGGFTWMKWFLYMAVPYYTFMFLGLIYIMLRYPLKKVGREQFKEKLLQKKAKLVFSKDDLIVFISLLIMVGLWVTDSLHGFHPVLPALIGLLILFLFTEKLNWKMVKESSALDTAIILAALFSLIEAISRFGVLAIITEHVSLLFPKDQNMIVILILLILYTMMINILIPNITACVTLLVPIYVSLAPEIGLSPMVAAFVAIMVIDGINFYPAQSTPLLMVYDGKSFNVSDVAQTGVAMTILFIIALIVVILPYWSWLAIIP